MHWTCPWELRCALESFVSFSTCEAWQSFTQYVRGNNTLLLESPRDLQNLHLDSRVIQSDWCGFCHCSWTPSEAFKSCTELCGAGHVHDFGISRRNSLDTGSSNFDSVHVRWLSRSCSRGKSHLRVSRLHQRALQTENTAHYLRWFKIPLHWYLTPDTLTSGLACHEASQVTSWFAEMRLRWALGRIQLRTMLKAWNQADLYIDCVRVILLKKKYLWTSPLLVQILDPLGFQFQWSISHDLQHKSIPAGCPGQSAPEA